jgi:hypothetical protein
MGDGGRSAAEEFLALHHGSGFVLPNAWDAGSARSACGG